MAGALNVLDKDKLNCQSNDKTSVAGIGSIGMIDGEHGQFLYKKPVKYNRIRGKFCSI
ncbi:hypothetical protein [Snodgrassella gandavensis]|uniref:hypothetical protein n=1 Tax=Snodgrassella gandavensis TaxID=2946698 RepID=UPI001EF63F4E|nr:hypothetical protein [Snodgrassella gandavensis]